MDDRRIRWTIPVILLIASLAQGQDAWPRERLDSLLAKVDRYRGLAGDHRSDLEIEFREDGKVTASSRYRLRVHPSASSRDVLLRVLSPEVENGNLILSSGQDMWILTRRTSRPVPVSVQQRLLGDASIGDVLNVDLCGRYRGSVIISGQFLDVNLEAVHPDALYGRIRLRLHSGSARPVESEFLTRSGRRLKNVRYGRFIRSFGQDLASELEITDVTSPSRLTRVRFSHFVTGKFPLSTFDKDNLRNLQDED
jgi:Outer membrane lipoprotein-sorting protein